ncbi:putative molybdenum cofactor biosynthesis protein [Ilumatobacter coccineus YM16-304]|uniref:Putative molybdenum cofactor biosynthesis protein n=2 Tax=Ilumatobacter coccineus TaxID=467094 RepID=A0A6C7E6C7_ILUCY|nr:putative molybdenum cofactor biosynthesis protein [Ilumatobacter coccineus YM16-304]
MRVAGVMLAGGKSSRMGRTKALVEIDGRPMGRRVLDALRSTGCDPVFAYGGDADELAPLGVRVEPDRHPGEGPVGAVAGLLGLISERDAQRAHDETPVDGAVVVACDLPDLDDTVVRALIDAAQRQPGAVAVARTERIEPLCAYWPIGVGAQVASAFDAGTRAAHRLLDDLHVVVVDVAPGALRNVNAPSDLD